MPLQSPCSSPSQATSHNTSRPSRTDDSETDDVCVPRTVSKDERVLGERKRLRAQSEPPLFNVPWPGRFRIYRQALSAMSGESALVFGFVALFVVTGFAAAFFAMRRRSDDEGGVVNREVRAAHFVKQDGLSVD